MMIILTVSTRARKETFKIYKSVRADCREGRISRIRTREDALLQHLSSARPEEFIFAFWIAMREKGNSNLHQLFRKLFELYKNSLDDVAVAHRYFG